ncbi:hypothetical protein MPTK1_7g02170 [Marchantia polymorpha subsp. ruderalis]|uniref:Uncharacterized protein n=2 Tax=Marchantia polymorpha TaxID=3197 RepID=A0AAF6BVB0_MARPO|nr:hypothetical protein MARPO_0088s0070 [Marchantia polymorpha]BBN15944.1 hypothetical protein Mp_7g02170 [Marchantia polymorpha subsp. ruderalis]|eukprot:PTQ33528.1 hypothetical protein MARPO_0088s0070 [Marchantia polymorpha]
MEGARSRRAWHVGEVMDSGTKPRGLVNGIPSQTRLSVRCGLQDSTGRVECAYTGLLSSVIDGWARLPSVKIKSSH